MYSNVPNNIYTQYSCAKRFMAILFTLLLMACSENNSKVEIKPLTVDDAVLAVLYSAPHGLSVQSGVKQKLLELLERQPEMVAVEVDKKINIAQLVPVIANDREKLFTIERAIQLLGHYTSPKGDAVLAGWYNQIQSHRKPDINSETNKTLERLSYHVLSNLGTRYAEPVVNVILDNWHNMSSNERFLSLAYLAGANKGRTDTAARLRELIDSSADDKQLLERALAYIEGS